MQRLWDGGSNTSAVKPTKFFYLTVKQGNPEDIKHMFNVLKQDIDNIIDSIISLVYFMRGAISYDEMLLRTPGERDRINLFLEKRLEAASHQMYPVY
jgi:hypothetical protein